MLLSGAQAQSLSIRASRTCPSFLAWGSLHLSSHHRFHILPSFSTFFFSTSKESCNDYELILVRTISLLWGQMIGNLYVIYCVIQFQILGLGDGISGVVLPATMCLILCSQLLVEATVISRLRLVRWSLTGLTCRGCCLLARSSPVTDTGLDIHTFHELGSGKKQRSKHVKALGPVKCC